MSYTILNQLIKKKQGPMDQLVYTLKLKKVSVGRKAVRLAPWMVGRH